MGRRYYSEGFKKIAVEYSFNSDKTCTEIAKELDISINTLSKWRKEYKNISTYKYTDQENEENHRLRKELEETKIENDKLREALLIFLN